MLSQRLTIWLCELSFSRDICLPIRKYIAGVVRLVRLAVWGLLVRVLRGYGLLIGCMDQ